MNIDVTDKVVFDNDDIDGECLPLYKCVCGKEFEKWHFILSIYEDHPHICSHCGRKLFFRNEIKVYEVEE